MAGSVVCAVLLLLICCKVAANCSSGFMELQLLKERAKKISNNGGSQNYLDGKFRLVPGMSFTCNGTITGLLLGVDIRSNADGRSKYPVVQVWRPGRRGRYTRVAMQQIQLAAGDFSPDGVFQYNLTTSIDFQNGDVLGVYQPSEGDSIVRLYRHSQSNAPVSYELGENPSSSLVRLRDLSEQDEGLVILIYPITTGQSCTSGFLEPTELRQAILNENINSVIVRHKEQRIFPDIRFNCNGSLIKWTVGAESDSGSSSPSEIQIWRQTEMNSYTKIAHTELIAQYRSSTTFTNVYEYILPSPLKFQASDILGVYQRDDSNTVPYYQENTGPVNLRESGERDSALDTLSSPSSAEVYDYPLVTVEIVPLLVRTTLATLLTSTAQHTYVTTQDTAAGTSNELLPSMGIGPPMTSTSSKSTAHSSSHADGGVSFTANSIQSSSHGISPIIVTVTSTQKSLYVFSHSPGFAVSSTSHHRFTPRPTLASSADNTGVGVVVILAIVVVLAVLSAGVVLVVTVIVVFTLRRMKMKKDTIHDQENEMTHYSVIQLDNPTYTAGTAASLNINCATFDQRFETSSTWLISDSVQYEVPTMSSPLPHSIQWGMIVPTMSQRKCLTDGIHHYESDLVYSTAQQSDPSSSPMYQTVRPSFFEETVTYWEPGSDCGTIYEQLAQKKFREIIRDQIQIVEHLGSGQFGLVNKGVWHSPNGPVYVAIKTLQAEASDQERVKFLQEAAIMGQFRHRNIITLHGMVTVGEPAMIVLELAKNGDLRQFLHRIKPIPGEMAPPSLPQQLLGYCRQIASGMEYLSKKSFVHRDLAARNILVDGEKTCKIADFGMSRDLSDSDYYVSQGGKIPVKWTAPEAIHFKKYSTASDVWSFAVLMYEIWSLGHKPFEEKTNHQAVQLVDSGYRLPPLPGCPRPVYQIMIDCWHPEASWRPTFSSLLSRLSQPEKQLLMVTDDNSSIAPALPVGAPIESSSHLYFELQQQYM